MAKHIQNNSLLLDWETKKSFWDYFGCESITQKLIGKKELTLENYDNGRSVG
jgi:hypothetical protein